MMKIGILPSSQRTSTGSGIGNHNERELMIDLTARLVPKLRVAGHVVEAFYAATEVGSDGAQALVAWHPQICIDLHLDSAGGAPAALLCFQEDRSLAMGLKILSAYCKAMGYRDKGGMRRTPGVSGVAVIRIPESAGIPTALIECGDMDAPDGYNWVRPEYREKAAVALAQAICSYAGGSITQPKPQEDDGMLYEAVGKEFEMDDCYVGRYDYWLHMNGKGKINITLVEHSTGRPVPRGEFAIDGLAHKKMSEVAAYAGDPKNPPVVGSYALRATCNNAIRWSLREIPK